MIKIWTRGQILAQKSTFSELPQNERERSPRHHEPNTIAFRLKRTLGARDIAICPNRQTGKKRMLTGQSVQSVRMLTWHDRTLTWRPYNDVACGDVASICWLTVGRMTSRHVALCGQMIGCHVAQSWAATWHPGIG
jgi:hypothetical protein